MHRVLIVESDPGLREELARALRRSGYRVEAVDGVEAAATRLAGRGFDAVLVDGSGPSGPRRLRRLGRLSADLGLIAVLAAPSVEEAVEAMRAGARDVLRKPFALPRLEDAVRTAVRARRPVAPRVRIETRDPGMHRLLEQAEAAAATEATVHITGESGTGKELLARFVHARSARSEGPLSVVNCAALPEELAESELFGHERGAFTGAVASRLGQIAAADGGTLVLDEIAEAGPRLQPKLLRVLQEREVHPVGSLRPVPVDVRVVVTTQRDLAREVAAGRFREDLFFRLDVIRLAVPPLRERRADIPLLAGIFLERFAAQAGVELPELDREGLDRLARHPFRGNVRELENLMRRAVVLFPGARVDVERLLAPGARSAPPAAGAEPETLNLKELERMAIRRSLERCGGNRTLASRVLGISVRTLRNKIRLYGLA